MVSPAYFAGSMQLGGLTQTASAFNSVQAALSFFITVYRQLAEWRAVIARLAGFEIDRGRAGASRRDQHAGDRGVPADAKRPVEIDDLAGRAAERQAAGRGRRHRVRAGDQVLVTGPSGSGKSTLFRAIAGIWPFGKRHGHGAARAPR